jgi:hypothetical protein
MSESHFLDQLVASAVADLANADVDLDQLRRGILYGQHAGLVGISPAHHRDFRYGCGVGLSSLRIQC